MLSIEAASKPAFMDPAFPIATVATGIPAGICKIDSNESLPSKLLVFIGTPITGICVFAAVMPGRCAAPPALAMITSIPRSQALLAYSNN